MGYQPELIEAGSFAEIEHLAPEWDRLAAARRWPFAEFAWLRACAEHLAPSSRIAIHLSFREGSLAAAAVFCRGRRIGAAFEIVGGALHEANVWLSEDSGATSALLRRLGSFGVPFVLSRMLSPAEIERDVSAAARRGRLLTINASGAPYLPLDGGLERFNGDLSANRRGSLARKRRKLERLGRLEFEAAHPGEPDAERELAEFERIEAAGWKGERGSSISQRPGFHGFFASALAGMARSGRLRVDRLKLDGKTLAIQFGLVSGRRYFLIKPTYDEAWSDYSPGMLLTYEAIKQSIAQGLESYEFLGGEDAWKLQWTSLVHPTRTWVFYPYSAAGAWRFASDAVEAARRRLFR